MEIGLYLRNIGLFKQIPEELLDKVSSITCGDHGCTYVLPSIEEIADLNNTLLKQNKSLHYISPKLNHGNFDDEFKRIVVLLKQGIGISINDWGLLYKLRSHIKPEHDICIGRLLSKSIAEWAWGILLLGGENDRGRSYLTQNSFNHTIKIDYFKNWGVKGIDVSVHSASEPSYMKMQSQGLYVTGFADNSYLAVSRACPIVRMENLEKCSEKCKDICTSEEYYLVPKREDQRRAYPKMHLSGNIVYRSIDKKPDLASYKRILYMWNSSALNNIKNTASFAG